MIFLCFGDSLTAGFPGYYPADDGISEGNGRVSSQYEYWLKIFCLEHLEKKGIEINDKIQKNLLFINKGIPGDTTTGLIYRINDLIKHVPKPSYSIIIIGTNDLGWSRNTDKILNNIKEVHQLSRANGIISIGGLIPPMTKSASSSGYDILKNDFNEKLSHSFNENNIPFTTYDYMMDDDGYLSPENTSGDGVHFSVKGYKQMGYSIFKNVITRILDENLKEFKEVLS